MNFGEAEKKIRTTEKRHNSKLQIKPISVEQQLQI